MSPREQLNYREIKVAALVWQRRTNPELGLTPATSEPVIKNQLRSVLDELGVWSRELALDMAWPGGARWADDFKTGTPWPPAASQTSLQLLRNQPTPGLGCAAAEIPGPVRRCC